LFHRAIKTIGIQAVEQFGGDDREVVEMEEEWTEG
jgi:hypothetical protein